MSREEVREKFRRLASTVLTARRVDRLEELVLNLEQVDDVRELVGLTLLES